MVTNPSTVAVVVDQHHPGTALAAEVAEIAGSPVPGCFPGKHCASEPRRGPETLPKALSAFWSGNANNGRQGKHLAAVFDRSGGGLQS